LSYHIGIVSTKKIDTLVYDNRGVVYPKSLCISARIQIEQIIHTSTRRTTQQTRRYRAVRPVPRTELTN